MTAGRGGVDEAEAEATAPVAAARSRGGGERTENREWKTGHKGGGESVGANILKKLFSEEGIGGFRKLVAGQELERLIVVTGR